MGVPVVGNLTKDASYFAKDGDKKDFATFRIAVNCGKDSDAAFLPVKCWGYAASDAKELKKGDKVVIEGRLCMEKWTKDGVERSEIGVIADSIGKVQRESSEHNF